jgi:hypothetical protein
VTEVQGDTVPMELTDLIVFEELRRLKYRYLRALDLKLWDEFADTLAPDATAHYGNRLDFTGRDAIVGYMRQTVGPEIITVHQCHHPELEVDGDQATGRWSLDDTVIITDRQALLRGAAFYEDRYVRRDGDWLIQHTGYERIYEAMLSLKDVPSYRLTANRWAPSTP